VEEAEKDRGRRIRRKRHRRRIRRKKRMKRRKRGMKRRKRPRRQSRRQRRRRQMRRKKKSKRRRRKGGRGRRDVEHAIRVTFKAKIEAPVRANRTARQCKSPPPGVSSHLSWILGPSGGCMCG
jgi:hypothetical protein